MGRSVCLIFVLSIPYSSGLVSAEVMPSIDKFQVCLPTIWQTPKAVTSASSVCRKTWKSFDQNHYRNHLKRIISVYNDGENVERGPGDKKYDRCCAENKVSFLSPVHFRYGSVLTDINPLVWDLDLSVDHGVADRHDEGGQQVLKHQTSVDIRNGGGPRWPALKREKNGTIQILTIR